MKYFEICRLCGASYCEHVVEMFKGYEQEHKKMLDQIRDYCEVIQELIDIVDGAVEDEAVDQTYIDSLTTQPARLVLDRWS